jgi:adenylyltransferase/sulfurtransferase
MQSRVIKIPKIPNTVKITQLVDYEAFCLVKSEEFKVKNDITHEELKDLKDYQLIDVREPHEYTVKNLGGELMPLSELEKYLPKIRRDKTVVVHCQSGMRSMKAIKLLQEKHGFDNLLNLKGGVNAVDE